MMNFTKYHGTGNDFILIDHEPKDPSKLSIQMCDRHMGIGADGLIFPSKSLKHDIKFNYYNSDGTIAPMCGNGMRTFVKYLLDEALMDKTSFVCETLSGPIAVTYHRDTELIEVDLGPAITKLHQPQLSVNQNSIQPYTLDICNVTVRFHTVMLGTLHTMVLIEEPIDIEMIGPKLAYHPFFPEATNVNFVTLIDNQNIHVKTYERGAGWTLSCGTGSAASAWLMHALGKTQDIINVSVPGGQLKVKIGQHVQLIGPAQRIAKGVYDIHE
jgi:diaminopimelate epimerase